MTTRRMTEDRDSKLIRRALQSTLDMNDIIREYNEDLRKEHGELLAGSLKIQGMVNVMAESLAIARRISDQFTVEEGGHPTLKVVGVKAEDVKDGAVVGLITDELNSLVDAFRASLENLRQYGEQ